MKLNKDALIKLLLTLTAIVVIFASLAKLLGGNSQTLEEYAKEHPEVLAKATEETNDTEAANNTEEADGTEKADTLEETDNTSAETEVLPDDPLTLSESLLAGAALNSTLSQDLRTTYRTGFYYEPLSDNLRRFITGISYPSEPPSEISYDELTYVHVLHYDFDGNPAAGELICNTAIAQDLVEIFYELYRNEYRIEQIHFIEEYEGDDIASMEANNTSCFNYRVVEGSTSLSKHALGLAVDINPLYNPYITYPAPGEESVSPASAQPYADRSVSFPYKIDEDDLCYRLFTEHGFIWGGNWNSVKDYQHFQKTIE